MPATDSVTPDPEPVWSVGEVARRLGLPASTLRTWERRYELGPSARSAGGHRRYDRRDLELLTLMSQLVGQGVTASDAARTVHRRLAADATEAPLPERAQWRTPEDLPDAVVEAARSYDVVTLRRLFADCLEVRGVAEGWTSHIVPTLRRIGEEWAAGGIGVEGEHLTSDCLLTALRAHVHSRPVAISTAGPVLLASAENDQHALPLLALQAALADEGHACHLLGPRTPATALAGMIAQLKPAGVFLWASMPRQEGDQLSKVIAAASASTTVLLGGPGWLDPTPEGAITCQDLPEAVRRMHAVLAPPPS